MSHTVPSQHPAVVLRGNYQHLRALLAIAGGVILGLTVAVVVLATSSNQVTVAARTTQSATQANPSAETGAKLDHSGRNATVTQTTDRLRSLTLAERRNVLGIAALSPLQRWAAFGTSPTPPAPQASHSGRNVIQTTYPLGSYPDAPPPTAGTPQPSVSYYPDAPQP